MKKLFSSIILLIIIFALSGCNQNSSSKSIIQDAASNFSFTVNNNVEDLMFHDELSHFGLELKSGDKLEWTENPSVSDADFSISINAEEFIAAGLDVTKLDSELYSYYKDTTTNLEYLIYKYNVNDENVTYENLDVAFEKLISIIPKQVTSIKNDGFVLTFDKGFQLHWNSDDRVNKDLAFIIVVDDLVKAGLDITKIDAWKLLKNKDPNDSQIKLVKVFYLK